MIKFDHDALVERLRRQKAEAEKDEFELGAIRGEEWAVQQARYTEIKEVVEASTSAKNLAVYIAVCGGLAAYEKMEGDERFNVIAGIFGRDHPSPTFVSGFCRGVIAVWGSVKGRVEPTPSD